MLVDCIKIIADDTKVAEELNIFFKTAVASLDTCGNPYTVENVENTSDPVEKAIKKIRISSKHFAYQK